MRSARKYYDEAMEIQAEYTAPENAIRYGSERAAYIACAQDIRWQEAVENEKFAERLANMYGQASLLQELERHYKEFELHTSLLRQVVAATKETNALLQRMLDQP